MVVYSRGNWWFCCWLQWDSFLMWPPQVIVPLFKRIVTSVAVGLPTIVRRSPAVEYMLRIYMIKEHTSGGQRGFTHRAYPWHFMALGTLSIWRFESINKSPDSGSNSKNPTANVFAQIRKSFLQLLAFVENRKNICGKPQKCFLLFEQKIFFRF